MNAPNSPGSEATYRGQPFVFPNFLIGVGNDNPDYDDPEAYYRCSSRQDRTYDQYKEAFGFDLGIFAGKCVLDLGAGVNATFAREAAEHGIDVISTNPNWRYEHYRTNEFTGQRWPGDGRSVAAVAQELPFRDGSFDAVISLWGVPTYLPGTKTEYARAFREIDRVLKPDGIGIMYPIARVTLKQPAFEEVLSGSFRHHEILGALSVPKLFVAKDESVARDPRNQAIKAAMAGPTELFSL